MEKIEYFTDTLIFSDTQKGDDNNKCKIKIPANSFIFDREENYIEYNSTLGKILHVTNITNEDVIKDNGITWNLENYSKRGLLKAKNTTAEIKQITKFDIYGNAYIQTAINETKTTHGKKSKEIEIKYLNNVTDIETLVNNIQNYYSYADYTIKLKSRIDYKIGSFVRVSETGMGTIYARIIKKISYKQKAFSYELEAISEFTPAESKTKLSIPSTKDSKKGKDGSAKFLPSLEVQGDYENQIGTYQGQLYRWTNNKWELLNAVMPLNPVYAYDFADVQYRGVFPQELKNYKKVLASIIAESWCYFYEPRFNTNLKEGCIYKVTADFKVIEGNPTHVSILYYNFTLSKVSEWVNTKVVKGRCTASITFKHTPSAGNMQILFYSGKAGYTNGIKSEWSNFRIETISDTQAIDSSGNGIHSKIDGDVEKVKDDKGGAALQFNKGGLTRPSQGFIGVGKQWSHSRWLKIDPNKQDANTNPRPWFYNGYDYSLNEIKTLNGNIGKFFWVSAYKDGSNKINVSIPRDLILNNEWHNLTVGTDLQNTYIRKIVYLDGVKVEDKTKEGDFKNWNQASDNFDMQWGTDIAVGQMANLIFFDRLLTDQEALWLSLNPQYPIKNYTLADWSISPDNPDNVVASQTPQYLGTVNVPPDNQNVFIVNGKKTGNNIANIGDWILIINNIDNYKKGWCYRWTGSEWLKLDPPENYSQEYTACLNDQLNKCKDLFDTDPHFFGTLFCQYLGFNEAVGKKLAANSGLFNNLTIKKLLIDNAPQNPNDFEMKINEDDGIRVKNGNKVLFEVSPQGKTFFSGELECQGFRVVNTGSNASATVLFSWSAGDNGIQCAQKILKTSDLDVDNSYSFDNPKVENFYGKGLYGNAEIRCVRLKRFLATYFNIRGAWVELLDNGGVIVATISASQRRNTGGGLTHITSDDIPFVAYKTSAHNFTFKSYTLKQKIYFPAVNYGKPSEANVIYKDENGFLKIS